MAKDPAFLLYANDWLGGTITFSRSHKGAYMDLLVAQFNHGHLPLDAIQNILGNDFNPMWEQKLKAKFLIDNDGLFYNKKLQSVIDERKSFTDGRLANLKAHKGSHVGRHVAPHGEDEEGITGESAERGVVLDVFSYWQKTLGHEKSKLDDKRRKKIAGALKLYKPDQLKAAIDGCNRSPFHQGENKDGKVWDDLELILRDAKHIDEFISMPERSNGKHLPTQEELEAERESHAK